MIAFAFPFRATLTAISGAFSGAGSGIGLALLHLALLAPGGAGWGQAQRWPVDR